jgi:hypothetical protein
VVEVKVAGSAEAAKVEEARVVVGSEAVETAAGVMAEAEMGAARAEETVEGVRAAAKEVAGKEVAMAVAEKGVARGVG